MSADTNVKIYSSHFPLRMFSRISIKSLTSSPNIPSSFLRSNCVVFAVPFVPFNSSARSDSTLLVLVKDDEYKDTKFTKVESVDPDLSSVARERSI
jgi:hypothetical protein